MRAASPRTLRSRLLTAVVATTALTLAGCAGGGGDDAPAAEPDSQPVEGGAELAALWPLTGEPVEGRTPDHPVTVVKIDNSASSSPQVGLGKADLVTEELVEGGITRLATFFYQQLPAQAGPVRSMRATDIGIVKPAHALLLASGGAPPTVRRMADSLVEVRTEGQGPGWARDGARSAPYNLMVNVRRASEAEKDLARVPASYLPWGSGDAVAAGRPAKAFDAVFSPAHTTSWRFDGTRYVNENSYAAQGDRFNPDNVLVLRVQQGDAGYLDPAGYPVPESIYEGEGNAVLFHGGKMVRGTWKKATRQEPLQLVTADGEELSVPAGRTWIELLPRDADGGRLALR